MKAYFNKVFLGIVNRIRSLFMKHPEVFVVVLSVVLVLLMEVMSRRSLTEALSFAVRTPVRFIVNVCIVALTLSLSLLFRRRAFFMTFFSLIWFVLGFVNFVVLGYRVTPFGFIDIQLLTSVISIIGVYLNSAQIVLLCVSIVAVIAGLVVLYIKAPKTRVPFKKALLTILVLATCTGASYAATTAAAADRAESFSNIAQAYEDYGFVYCFSTGAVDRGINCPEDYSEETVLEEVSDLLEPEMAEQEVKPDIILVQLESFFDVGYLESASFEEDPIPVFSALKERYSTGFLTVPSCGAGTANTEFEVLSGLSLDFFGMGEYPYKTILQKTTCESLPANLAELGYTAHAIHNNTGTFYGRDVVFSSLGFDTFTPIECMQNVDYNKIGWCNDDILTGEIIKALDSTEGQDFVFTVTVQGHGKYQRGAEEGLAEEIGVSWPDHPEEEDEFAYYVTQLHETDAFIGELVAALEERGEPAVLVLYGDHLPTFPIEAEELENGDLFETEYVMWDNLGLEKKDRDISAYQLSAEIQSRLGMETGLITRLHQRCSDDEDYMERLELLGYDMLYGSQYCWGGENPYSATDLQIGSEPVVITDVEWADGVLSVTGENFTEWSVVAVDGESRDTAFVSGTCIQTEMSELPEDGMITVRQETENQAVLAESDGFAFRTHEAD